MGTEASVTVVAASRGEALDASERIAAALEAAEARLSTWREDSELARLNRAPLGIAQELSPELAAELAAARACRDETGGAFDPGVGDLVAAWGLRQGGRLPEPEALRAAVLRTGVVGVEIVGRLAIRRLPVLLEEGGFGKGAALAAARSALAEAPGVHATVIDLGGQVVVTGGPRSLTVADPRQRDRAAVAIEIDRGSLATSGNGERGFEIEGRRYGHLLDPRSGQPAADFGSMTVWTDDPLRADCLSTGLFVLGPEAALEWVAAHPGVEVLALIVGESGLTARASPGFAGRLTALSPEVSLTFGSDK
jgi:thiamine biosynthesis lipoprotein